MKIALTTKILRLAKNIFKYYLSHEKNLFFYNQISMFRFQKPCVKIIIFKIVTFKN